ncbi:hypothetical protein DCWBC2_0239 [Dehalococcoides mccartyi]|nr:hypothetical protein DCWBC2_0239 [Dehalococcoides mccartyi]
MRKQHLYGVDEAVTSVIGIKRYPRTAFYRILLAPAALEVAEDVAANVLCGIAAVFGEFLIFSDRLCGTSGQLEPLAQFLKCSFFVDPPLRQAAVAVGYFQISHCVTSSHLPLKYLIGIPRFFAFEISRLIPSLTVSPKTHNSSHLPSRIRAKRSPRSRCALSPSSINCG